MRLVSLEVSGLLAIRHASLDFSTMGPLVALVGDNGAGKTTLLEACLAALYRRLASRDDNVSDLVSGDAFVEAVFANADEWRARLSVAGARRKVEQHLLRNGLPVTTGKAGEVAAAVERAFGSRESILSSVFCAQNRAGDFTLMGRAERKALFVEALQLGRLERLAQGARDHGRAASAALDVRRAATAVLDEKLARRQAINAELDAERAASEEAGRNKETADALVERLREELAAGRLDEARAEAAAEALRAARQRYDRGAEILRQAGLREAEALEAFDARATALLSRRGALERRRAEALAGAAVEVLEAGVVTEEALAAARLQEDGAEAEYQAVVAHLDAAKTALAVALREQRVAEAEDAAREREHVKQTSQAALLDRVPCTASDIWQPLRRPALEVTDLASACPLLELARVAKAGLGEHWLSSAPGLAKVARSKEEQHRASEEAATTARAALQAARERTALAREAERRASAAIALRDAAASVAKMALADLERVDAETATLGRERAAERDRLGAETAAADAAQLENAYALNGAKAEADRYGDVLSKIMDLELRHAEAAAVAKRLGQQYEAHAQRVANLEGQLAAMAGELTALADAKGQLVKAGELVEDWQLLSDTLGRDGIQALEVDAAGPAVALICNDLLTSCYDPRFSLRFETIRHNRSNDGSQEVFDIVVLDDGKERHLAQLSGGEQVIVREALALALAIWNTQRTGAGWRTLFRDETAGALSTANAVAYTTMLRRALAYGFEQVIFVSHQDEVNARADTRVRVGDGTAAVA